MLTIALGHVSGPLPTPPTGVFDGLVHAIIVAADPGAGGITTFQQWKFQGVTLGTPLTIVSFNKPAATGGMGQPYRHGTVKECNSIDPTEYQIGGTAPDGAFVTYLVD